MFTPRFAARALVATAAAALVAGAAIAPASAALREDPASEAKAAPAKQADTPEAKPKKYCVIGVVTGSISQRVCKTRDQWIKQDGFDPLAHK